MELNSGLQTESDDVSDLSSVLSDFRLSHEYNETEENRAMRESMENMVTNSMPQDDSGDQDDIVVLSPGHPMLRSFHKSVACHLEKQKNQILNDILELTAKVKTKRNEADDDAEKLYGIQQTCNRQKSQLELQSENLLNDTEVRQELDSKIQELRELHKEQAANVTTAQNNEEKLWRKLDENSQKEQQARQKKENENSKLSVVLRTTEKANIEKKALAEEKKKQDERVYWLTCEVSELQSRLSQLETQLQAKRKEQCRLAEATSSAATDLVTQNDEQMKLVQAWQRLLISAQSKDRAYSKLLSSKETVKEENKVLEVEIQGYQRGGTQEMERNEKLTLCVKHLERDILIVGKKLETEKQNVEEEQVQLASVNTMLKLTEEDLIKAKQVSKQREDHQLLLDKEIVKCSRENFMLEQHILESISEQASQDNAVHNAIKQVEKLNKEVEEWVTILSQKEATASSLGLEVQKQKFQEACTAQLLKQNKSLVDSAHQQLNEINLELQHAQANLVAQQSVLDKLNKQVDALMSKTGGKEESLIEIKIAELEDQLKKVVPEIDTLQKKLLRKELSLLEKTKMHTKLKKEVDDCKKYEAHMQHKVVTQRDCLEKARAQEASLQKKIEESLHSLQLMDKENSKLKKIKESLEHKNIFAYKDIIAARKEEEQEIRGLEKCFDQLSQEKEELHQVLSELQRQQVDLESKVTLATETKQAIEKERGSTGEIAALKSEIHRMEVRLGQLKRTQERMTLDLDQCVLRRDAMVDSARARNTRLSGHSTSYMKTTRKLENLRHSNKQMQSKIQQLHIDNASFKAMEEEIKTMEEELTAKQKEIMQIKEPYLASDARLESLLIRKKQNLEQLVHEQRRCRGLSDAKEGRYKPTHRSEVALTAEAQRQRVTRTNILSVLESLRPDFPLLGCQLATITALLKSIKVTYTIDSTSQDEPNEATQS